MTPEVTNPERKLMTVLRWIDELHGVVKALASDVKYDTMVDPSPYLIFGAELLDLIGKNLDWTIQAMGAGYVPKEQGDSNDDYPFE